MAKYSFGSWEKWSKLLPESRQPLKALLKKIPNLYFSISLLLSAIFIIPSAQAASCKVPKSYYKNVSCTATNGYFLAVKDFGEPVALIDSKGKVILDLTRYQKVDANNLADGLLPVLSKGRVGYIDMQGREVIPTSYDMLSNGKNWARPVSEGRIVVKKAGQYGVISTDNQTIVPFSGSISAIDNYRGGVARVSKNKAISWLDKNGSATANPNAVSPKSSNQNDTFQASSTKTTPNKSPVQNNELLSPASTIAQMPLPPVGFTTLQPQQQDGKWGFVDDNHVLMITYSFDEVRPFSEALAGVRIDNNWGFLNLGGELVIPLDFDNSRVIYHNSAENASAFVFKNGKAWVSSLNNGSKICIDKQGAYVGCD